MRKDEHGQPWALLRENFVNNIHKADDVLTGICIGILADGEVSDKELLAFCGWIRANTQLYAQWPLSEIRDRVEAILPDGEKLNPDRREELVKIVHAVAGHAQPEVIAMRTKKKAAKRPPLTVMASGLPFDDPAPAIEYRIDGEAAAFVITGKFAYGERKAVRAEIERAGGVIHDRVMVGTHYLLVGEYASRDWSNASFGSKILKAVQYRKAGHPVRIISEKTWQAG